MAVYDLPYQIITYSPICLLEIFAMLKIPKPGLPEFLCSGTVLWGPPEFRFRGVV
jgi:hypothetical protein